MVEWTAHKRNPKPRHRNLGYQIERDGYEYSPWSMELRPAIGQFANVRHREAVANISTNCKQFTQVHMSINIVFIFCQGKQGAILVNLPSPGNLNRNSNAYDIESLQAGTNRADRV